MLKSRLCYANPGHTSERILVYSKDICTPMFIAVLFTIAKLWNQPRCPSTGKSTENVIYLHKEIFSHKEKYTYCLPKK
jgi:hypothetical protein